MTKNYVSFDQESSKIENEGFSFKLWKERLLSFLDKTQLFFLLLSIPVIVAAPYCFMNIVSIVEETRHKQPNYVGPCWFDFCLLFITVPLIAFQKYLVYRSFKGFYEKYLPLKYQGKLRDLKIKKACENIFKVIHFVGISIYGYYAVIKQLPFESPIFGNGDWNN